MQVVIDIPEKDYELACNYPDALINIYAHAIKKGTVLPKHYGRLVDVDSMIANMSYKCECGQLFRLDAVDPEDYQVPGNEEFMEAVQKNWFESFCKYIETRAIVLTGEEAA